MSLCSQIKFGDRSPSSKAKFQIKEPLGGQTTCRPRVAIIGGGVAGTSASCLLVEAGTYSGLIPDIDVFETSGEVGPGRNWRLDDGPSAKSNNAVGRIDWSPAQERQSHFATHYLQLPPGQHGNYFQRSDFGAYLIDSFGKMAGEAGLRGATIRVIPETVDSIAVRSSTPWLHGKKSAWGRYDAVILAPGNGNPTHPFGKPLEGANYFHDPVPGAQKLARIASLPPTNSGIIVGTSLSGIEAWRVIRGLEFEREAPANVDFPTWLRKHGRPITIASRSGLAPVVEMPVDNKLDLRCFTDDYFRSCVKKHGKVTLKDFTHALSKEFREHGLSTADIEAALSPAGSPKEQLQDQMDALEGRNERLRTSLTLLKKMARHDQFLWNYGDDALRALFQKRRSQFARVRGVIRPDFGRELLDAMNSGNLQIVGGLTNVQNDGNRYSAQFESDQDVPFDFVVNAATHGGMSSDNPLITNLIANGAGLSDGFGGIKVDFHTQRLLAPGKKSAPPIWAVGNVTQGTHYDQNSVFRLGCSAERAVEALEVELAGFGRHKFNRHT